MQPIELTPWIRCYRIHAYMMNIVGIPYPDFQKYVLSNYLCLHNGKENIRREYLDFHLENNFLNISDVFRDNTWFDIIQLRAFDCDNYNCLGEIKQIIVEMLEKGYYVLHKVNEVYLPHTAAYGGAAANNINTLTCGYDDKSDVFFMLDYDGKGQFGISRVLCDDYLSSIAGVTVSNCLNFMQAKKNLTFQFDLKKSLQLIKCYIFSENAYPNHDDYKNNIFGYEGVERTLNDMEKNGINMIRVRAIMEHKEILLKYMKYVTDHNCIDSSRYYNDYFVICKDMKGIFMKVLKKMITCEDRCDYRKEIDMIRQLNEVENHLLERYLSEMNNFF